MGCIHSLAINFNPEATLTDFSCNFRRVAAKAALFGNLRDCNAFLDSNGNKVFDPSTEYNSTTNAVGYYVFVYPPDDTGYVLTEATYGRLCQDTISLQTGGETGTIGVKTSFEDTFLRTTTSASMSTPFTTIATEMVSSGKVSDYDTASAAVCEYMIPCIPCELVQQTFHLCTASNCVEVCQSHYGFTYSVFTLDALFGLLNSDIEDLVYALWMIYQYATMNAISCAQEAISSVDGRLVFQAATSVLTTKVANGDAFDFCNEDGSDVIDLILEAAQVLDMAQLLEEPPTSAGLATAATTCGTFNAYLFAMTMGVLHPSSTTLPTPSTSSTARSFPTQPSTPLGSAPFTQAFTNSSLTTTERLNILFGGVPSEFDGCMDSSAANYNSVAIVQTDSQVCQYV